MELVGSCVRSDERGAHNLLKLHSSEGSSKVKDTTDVGVLCSRYETGSCVKTRSYYRVYTVIIPYYYGLESNSLYTRNTS